MKSLFSSKLLFVFVFALLLAPTLFAQTTDPPVEPENPLLEQIEVWLSALLGSALLTFAGFVTLMISVTAFINTKVLPIPESGARQWISWIVGLAIGALGYWLEVGIYSGVTIPIAGVITIGGILAANGLYTTDAIYNALVALGMLKAKSQ